MPNYGVVMGQGATVADLTNNTLVTGYGNPADKVFTCSAVIFYNANTHACGLYHFPEGNINDDAHSRDVMTAIRDQVQPTVAYIGVGTFGLTNDVLKTADQIAQTWRGEQLRSWVGKLLPQGSGLKRFMATSGVVSVTRAGGNPVLGNQEPDPIVDLRALAAGNHGAYRTYGHDMV